MKRTKKTTVEKKETKLSTQILDKMKNNNKVIPPKSEYEGNSERITSTGSTLLDLAISGGRFREGGIPAGILVEIFGPSGSGKTVLLCQIAGNLQKKGGNIMFHDPEARLNKQFARMFHLDTDAIDYTTPDTVPEVFKAVRKWEPDHPKQVNGIFADSLAALSTDLEMDKEEGDKMGMRRAKEFSEETRKTCRIITKKDYLMVCSNQIRQNSNAGPYEPKYRTPGGEAIAFYSSLRLRCKSPQKIKEEKSIGKKKHTRVIGVATEIDVFKSSVWKPHNTALVYIIFDYGVDDIRANLKYLKTNTSDSIYQLNGKKLGKSINHAIKIVERDHLESELKEAVIDLWNDIESRFKSDRKPRIL